MKDKSVVSDTKSLLADSYIRKFVNETRARKIEINICVIETL